MRPVLLILILVVLAAIVLVATGLVDINAVRGARAPDVDASRNGISASGGQAPAFDVETGSVAVTTRDTTVKMPTVQVRPAGDDVAPTENSAAR